MISLEKLRVLTEGAKYDVSCSSSGSSRKNAGGIGNGYAAGCCHSFTPDGRCISLLKMLLSNDCIYECKYCPNRSDADVPKLSASPEEICELTMSMYKRNYIEGLFLSSAIVRSPDHTMDALLDTVRLLRTRYRFHGYIHLKGIPRAHPDTVREAAKYVDRMSFNIELPSERSLKLLAPQKSKQSLLMPMRALAICEREHRDRSGGTLFLPAGQTTQMIVGASPEHDGHILRLSERLYRSMRLRRVYYSSYVPVVQDPALPDLPAEQLREHRLYQADWLLRFYGFSAEELIAQEEDLSLDHDPKCAWALRNPQLFPIEINRAPLELLLRVPGIGCRSAQRILAARRYAALRYDDLKRMRVVLKRARHFITCGGKFFGEDAPERIRCALGERHSGQQLNLFSERETALSALSGEL